METSSLPVANEIRRQIGGRALFMMGARNLLGDANSLRFNIRGSPRVNVVRVTLNALDLYDVEFIKARNLSVVVVCTRQADCDCLRAVIETETGLRLSL